MSNLSMFSEFEKTVKDFKRLSGIYGDRCVEHILPAMIILERKTSGENKHAIVGQPIDAFTLFEWGINQLAEGFEIDFDDALMIIKEIHNSVKPICINDFKGEIE